jgi:UPF0755 protein
MIPMKKKIWFFLIFLILTGILTLCLSYKVLFADNILERTDEKNHLLYIKTGSSFEDVLDQLQQGQVLKNTETFKLVAGKTGYAQRVKPGRYSIPASSGNLRLIRKLLSGAQDPVRITFNNIQNKEQLAEKIAEKLETDKNELLRAFNNDRFLDSLNLTEDNFPTIFLANTYEFYWNTSARQFIERMLKEYKKFWTSERVAKAESLSLSPTEVIILASIVQKESNHYDEYSRIAGVYVNRLQRGMALQADPTVMFALKKLGIVRRVYRGDLKVNSPYNTYMHTGLPPGPICLPELKSIDETLDAEEHNYMYFCAKEDFSGYHAFAETWEQHKENAARYQRALNKRNIR